MNCRKSNEEELVKLKIKNEELKMEDGMSKENIIQNKSYDFALRIIKLNQMMVNDQKEYVLSKQILKSGTSVGANVEEAIGGQSRKDFRAKIFIAYKEARETHYWLRLLRDSSLISKKLANSLLKSAKN
ncbi:MAG TPA: four helix bundle protein [Balneolaceae bacterium]|nr:four helix bundle protein [Balneolaceae bacterium]